MMCCHRNVTLRRSSLKAQFEQQFVEQQFHK
jgi:hypothetical protein